MPGCPGVPRGGGQLGAGNPEQRPAPCGEASRGVETLLPLPRVGSSALPSPALSLGPAPHQDRVSGSTQLGTCAGPGVPGWHSDTSEQLDVISSPFLLG